MGRDYAGSQADMILEHLRAGRTITPLEALERFGCLRLAARVAELRDAGYAIATSIETKNGKRFACYYMESVQ